MISASGSFKHLHSAESCMPAQVERCVMQVLGFGDWMLVGGGRQMQEKVG